MAAIEKPDLDEELLIHFGIKGMKWGVRSGKGKTGVTRHRGALLDRNARQQHRIKAALKGDKANSVLADRAVLAIGQKILGRDQMRKNMEQRVSNLKAQDARVKAGKLSLADRFDLTIGVSVPELVISNRPK